MMVSIARALALSCALSFSLASAQSSAPSTIRMVDLNGDGELDLFEGMADGSLVVSLGSGGRHYEQLSQELPRAIVTDVLAGDFNDDGFIDLYLVTAHANIALVGDGTGLLTDFTLELGLQDEGVGQSAILRDLDADGRADLFLFNQIGDVLFWGVLGGFERDARTPFVPAPTAATPVAGIEHLPTPSLNGRNSESVRGSTLVSPNTLPNQHSGGPRPVAIDPTAPLVPLISVSRSNPSAPVLAGLAQVATSGTLESALGSPKHHFVLTRQQHKILSMISLEDLPDGLGGTVQTVRLTGANLQVVNGLGVTESLNGLGNLIVGYNELGNPAGDNHTGSHNIVGGNENNFSSSGGLVMGEGNGISAEWASVSGGSNNYASGPSSSVSGGLGNSADGFGTSVSGGYRNRASGYFTSVSGGAANLASGGGFYFLFSYPSAGFINFPGGSVSGGRYNTASGYSTSVSGGVANHASGGYIATRLFPPTFPFLIQDGSSISGGNRNSASGFASSVSGGAGNAATASGSSVSAGLGNSASGSRSSVSGGSNRTASGYVDWVAGSLLEDN